MAALAPDEGLTYELEQVPRSVTLWLGLFTSQTPATTPGAESLLSESRGVSEVQGKGYHRVAVPAGAWGRPFPVAGGMAVESKPRRFPEVGPAGWGRINGFLLATASVDGVALVYANFDGGLSVDAHEGVVVEVVPRYMKARCV